MTEPTICNRCKSSMQLRRGGIVPDENGRYETDWDNKDYSSAIEYGCSCGNTLTITYAYKMQIRR